MGAYDIESEKVGLSMNWGVSAVDYQYSLYGSDGKLETRRVDFQDLLVLVGSRKATVTEGEITPMAARMRTRNTYLSKLGAILAELTKVQAEYSGDDSGGKVKQMNISWEQYKILTAIPGAANKVHYESGVYQASKAEYEGLVQAVKSEMDKENNNAQTDMTRLQSLVDARDNSYSTATSIMSAISDTRSNLIGNL